MSGKRKQRGEDFKQEDILQAVVVADSFNVRFAPITKSKPRALLPLVNVPLLEYTLEFLCSAGIQEVIIFCCAHANQIKAHIAQSKWSRTCSPMEVVTVVSEDCRSVGDALRDLEAKSLVTNDFVLVNGDMVANVKLKPIIEEHKARRLREKTPIMTMLFKKAPPGHMTRCREDEVVLAVRRENSRVLKYHKVASNKRFDFPLEIFQGGRGLQLRHDLLDTHISICSPHVPALFTDEFDYQTRDDFVKGILNNEEILGHTVHVHVIEEEYAARVSNLYMYDAVSRDVTNRWSYPLVPDTNISGEPEGRYSYGRHNVYLHKDVSLARGCILQENVVIGRGSSIGSNTCISHATIGNHCTIGENVKIDGAYIWDHVTIEANSALCQCLVDDGVHIKSSVKIGAGCVLAKQVVVGPNISLDVGTMLTSEPLEKDEFGDEVDDPASQMVDPLLVGAEGHAYRYHLPADEDEDEDDGELNGVTKDVWGLRLESSEEEGGSTDTGDEEEDGDATYGQQPDEAKMFYEEVLEALKRALVEDISTDHIVLEINSVKHAYGIQIGEVNVLVTKAIMEFPLKEDSSIKPTTYLTQLKQNFKKFLPVLQNYIRSEESQMECLNSLEEFCLTSETAQTVLLKVLQYFYEAELLLEAPLLEWHRRVPTTDDSDQRKLVRKKVEKFIEWLEEAEEETDSDD